MIYRSTLPSIMLEDSRRVIFIVGVGRSGTSLLQSMLHAHPNISFLPEIHFFRRYIASTYSRFKYEKLGVKKFQSKIADDNEFERAGMSANNVLEPFMDGGQKFDLVRVYNRLLNLYRARKGVDAVGVKDPRLIDYLPQVKQAFPGANILHIIRDPRDVVLSRMNANWSAGRPDWLHALTYRAQIKRGHTIGGRLFGAQYMEVHYEELLAEPERILQDLAEHLGVPYSNDMLAFQSSAEELVHESEYSWKKETMGPLLRDNSGKWREGLSGWQVCLTEQICNKAFECFGYERATCPKELSYTQKFFLQLFSIGRIIFDKLYPAVIRVR